MALAIVKQGEPRRGHIGLDLELGRNQYFRIQVGERKTVNNRGFLLMDLPARKTGVLGPLAPQDQGRISVTLPRSWFDRDNRFLQVLSYQDAKGKGPAVSEIIAIHGFTDDSGDELLALPFSTTETMSIPDTYNTSFTYKELPLSQAQSILDLLKGFLPGILGGAGKALGQIQTKNPAAQETLQATGALIQSDQVKQLLEKLLAAVLPGKNASQAQSVQMSHAEAMAIPIPIIDALLKAVPALAPVLQSAVKGLTDPKFIDAVGRNSPVTKILDSGHELAKGMLGLDVDIQTEVEDMTNFGNDTNALLNNMLKLSAGKSLQTIADLKQADNRQLKEAKIDFIPRPEVLLTLKGMESEAKVADLASLHFAWGKDVVLPLDIKSPKPLSRALVKLCLKSVTDKEVKVRKKWRIKDEEFSNLDSLIRLSASELKGLQPNEEYFLDLRVIWPNRKKQRLGTSLHRLVKFVKGYVYDRVELSGETPIPLNDLKTHRAFWHKVWGAGLTEEFREIDLDAKYYLTLGKGVDANRRMESLTQFSKTKTGEDKGKLKSGMEWGLASLNALIPLISSHPSLSEEELKALDNSGFAHRFTQVGRQKLNFWGLDGESVALWVYPEIVFHEVLLQKASEISEHGLILKMEEHRVQVPIPKSVHFIGTQM